MQKQSTIMYLCQGHFRVVFAKSKTKHNPAPKNVFNITSPDKELKKQKTPKDFAQSAAKESSR